MARKSVLIIDESPLFCSYLSEKLKSYSIIVIKASNGIEGINKISHHHPDLVICDYFLKQAELLNLLKKKHTDSSISSIPVIVVSNPVSRDKLLEFTQYKVKNFFTRPIKIDLLWGTISEILNVPIELDNSPCILDTRINEDILFVEIAMGLNTEKIHMLDFRVKELLTLHSIDIPKILIMFSNIDITEQDRPKLHQLLDILTSFTRGRIKWVRVLTQSQEIAKIVQSFWEYAELLVTDNLEKAIDDLTHQDLKENLIQSSEEHSEGINPMLELRFQQDMPFQNTPGHHKIHNSDLVFAVVDDDFVAQEMLKKILQPTGCQLYIFSDGQSFLQAIPSDLDLLLLDLMMPNLDGFHVLEYLKTLERRIPVIILSALSGRETVLRAMNFGISSYITKPIQQENVMKKIFETLDIHLSKEPS